MGKPECKGWWGRKFGHKYEHIFDEVKGEPTLAECHYSRRVGPSGIDTSPSMLEVVEASKASKSTYVYSICKRCGDRIYRHQVDQDSER